MQCNCLRSPIWGIWQARPGGLCRGENKTSLAGADTASGAVFEAAQEYLPVGKTAYHEHLNALAEAGIVVLMPGTGRRREIRLRYDAGDVAAACIGSKNPGSIITPDFARDR